ncbi:MAG TPA: gamma-glutamyl-gamma-aminobutyrate hydrolase family protein [bacterium]|nr:gamma-glutamyl-gamma-aminobutyrate hydrolase family protein [bacterium]
MNKFAIRLLITVALILTATGRPGAHPAVAADSVRILLVNPGRGDIEDMIRMVETRVVPLDHPLLIAVYGAQVERSGAAIRDHLGEQRPAWLRFEIIAGELTPENLYRENPCTPDFRRLLRESDAALFYGGADIPPAVYGQKTGLLTAIVTPERHFFELSFLFHLLGGRQNPGFTPLLKEKPDYVIRAFCLGMQTMNVAAGGTMVQDIASEIYKLRFVEDYLALDESKRHDNYWSRLFPHDNFFWCHFQPIRFKPESPFVREMGMGREEYPLVCSSHHQAVKKLGRDLQAAAVSLDGKVVEALTHQRYRNLLGVQFHPENGAIYAAEGNGHKVSPADTVLVTMHDYLKARGSLEFHLKFWRHFAAALQPAP